MFFVLGGVGKGGGGGEASAHSKVGAFSNKYGSRKKSTASVKARKQRKYRVKNCLFVAQ